MDERRLTFLERNRMAASKCRLKKKQWIMDLENRAEIAERQNIFLQESVAKLKNELISIKHLFLSHKNCECNLVQKYVDMCNQPGSLNPDSDPA